MPSTPKRFRTQLLLLKTRPTLAVRACRETHQKSADFKCISSCSICLSKCFSFPLPNNYIVWTAQPYLLKCSSYCRFGRAQVTRACAVASNPGPLKVYCPLATGNIWALSNFGPAPQMWSSPSTPLAVRPQGALWHEETPSPCDPAIGYWLRRARVCCRGRSWCLGIWRRCFQLV